MTFSRPDTLDGSTTQVKTGFGNLYVTINEVDGKPIEVIAQIGKSGQATLAMTEAIGRLATLALQEDIDVSKIIHHLKGIGDERPQMRGKRKILSIPDAIGQVLGEKYDTKH
jgi:ribonucleoside-diphosphate reductase alpha chain